MSRPVVEQLQDRARELHSMSCDGQPTNAKRGQSATACSDPRGEQRPRMARPGPPSVAKRKREAAKREKRQAKHERRARRAEERAQAREAEKSETMPREDK